jgi:hypothetical protein
MAIFFPRRHEKQKIHDASTDCGLIYFKILGVFKFNEALVGVNLRLPFIQGKCTLNNFAVK